MVEQLEEALDSRGYFRPAGKKPKMLDNLKAVLSRPAFSEQEISVLRGVISSLDRFSRKHPRGKSGPFAEAPIEDSEHDGGDVSRNEQD
jgi:tRNA/rRNA methyltransferase